MSLFDSANNLEFRSADEIRALQEERFKCHLQYAAARSPFYGRMFREHGIDTANVGLDSISSIPLTGKQELAENNDSFLAVPMSRVVDIVLSSGTTGKPVKVMYTERDLQRLAYNEEISFRSCGITADDTVLLTCTIDRCFIAGLAYFSGVRAIGASAIRNGHGSLESHLDLIGRLKPTAIVGVPTFLLRLGLFLQEQGIEPVSSGIKSLICIGEPVRGRNLEFLSVGEQLESVWGARVYSTYASSESITSFCECGSQCGGHLHPDLAVLEIVDDAGKILPPGESGEVVITPLAMEGMPLVRFRTGDVSFIIDSPCSCGRNSVRLGPILGRKSQMIKFKGTTLYPNAINSVMEDIRGVEEYYVNVSSGYDLSDIVKVVVSVRDSSCTADMIAETLKARLRVRPEVLIAGSEEVKGQVYLATSRKLCRFVDERTRTEEKRQ